MTKNLVELQGVTKRYDAVESAAAPEILRGIELVVEAGHSVAIVGPSGSGKSTILNIIGALLPPTSGTVLFDGTDVGAMNDEERARLRNEEIGYVFQSHHLLPQCSALENVLVPTLVDSDKTRRAGAKGRALELLNEVGLKERMGHRPAQLSGGECQRVALVRSLINEPRLILADEPTGSLDSSSADKMGELLCRLNEKQKVALVTVTHSERLAARMKHTYELRSGKLTALEVSS